MTETDILLKYDLDKFRWKPLSGRQGRTRLLMGTESGLVVWSRYAKPNGETSLFVATHVDLGFSVLKSDLERACRDVWIWLRYNVPTIACRIVVDEQDQGSFVYEVPTPEELDQWTERTFLVDNNHTDLDELRRILSKDKIPSDLGDLTWLHIVPGPQDSNDKLCTFGLLLRTHHSPYDGAATKIIINRYLTRLAKSLCAEGSTGMLDWGKEVDNLVPAVCNVLAPSEALPIPPTSTETPTFNHPYYASLLSVLQNFGASRTLEVHYGFTPRKADTTWAPSDRKEISFSKDESDKIFASLKPAGPGNKYTLTHLAHAALALTVISDNPPTSSDSNKILYNVSLADRRASLQEPYSHSGKEGYIGYATSTNATSIPVSTFLSSSGEVLAVNKSTLVKTMRVVRDIYISEKSIPTLLSFMARLGEFVCSDIKQAAAANQVTPNQNYSFSSDGIGEKYLDETYTDTNGNSVLNVTRIFTSVNRVDPGPFFRMWSWRGVIFLGADLDSNFITGEDVQKYLAKWKEVMLLVSQFDDGDY